MFEANAMQRNVHPQHPTWAAEADPAGNRIIIYNRFQPLRQTGVVWYPRALGEDQRVNRHAYTRGAIILHEVCV
jgi:hypothetical protein